jgi:site-specific recombinase XerD
MTQLLKFTLATLLESFFYQHLMAQRRASPATVSAYRDAWRLFLLFVSERIGKPPCRLSLQELGRDVVLAFLDHLELERHNTVSTRNVRLTAIRSFFQYVA